MKNQRISLQRYPLGKCRGDESKGIALLQHPSCVPKYETNQGVQRYTEELTMNNMISVSSASLAKFENKLPYCVGTFRAMKRILQRRAVDGFELLYRPEWDGDCYLSSKNLDEDTGLKVLSRLQIERFPLLSIHARKDVGVHLCSRNDGDIEKGKRLIRESLLFAKTLAIGICVFHLWDTFATRLDIDAIKDVFQEVADSFPDVKASVENIPTSADGKTPFDLVNDFKYLTLDTRWAMAYDELDAFRSISSRIVNVHLRGELKGEKWVFGNSTSTFNDIVKSIGNDWKYSGILTVEPDGTLENSQFDDFVEALLSLRALGK